MAPTPREIYQAAEQEGRRRLEMPPLEQISTAFIAGVTIVFGIAALGVTQALAEPDLGAGPARILAALAFGIGLVFLVVGRSELFTENFFDPVAAAIDDGGRAWVEVLRLWAFTLALNLVGGAVLVAVLTVEGALPTGAPEALTKIASEVVDRGPAGTLARAVLAGALLTQLSYLLHAVDSTRSRISLAFMAGFLVALGPFDHVVVTALHLLFGVWLGGAVGYGDVVSTASITLVGNLVGGIGLMTLTHTAQVKGARSTT